MKTMFGRGDAGWPKMLRAVDASATVPAAALRSHARRVMRFGGAMGRSIANKKSKAHAFAEAIKPRSPKLHSLKHGLHPWVGAEAVPLHMPRQVHQLAVAPL